MIADVLVFRAVDQFYSYKIEDDLTQETVPGVHVHVPLGRSKSEGVVMAVRAQNESRSKLRSITKLTPRRPVLSQSMRDLVTWFADHYKLSPYKAFQTVVGNRKLRKKMPVIQSSANPKPDLNLTADQKAAKHQINTLKKKGGEVLLHGVTGSGKTEIYIQVARDVLESGKSVIICLPEIALTPQVKTHFVERFGDQVSVVHSGLTVREREIEWNRIYLGQARIVIGPRSAIFSPVENIGLIVVDEEHETTYKQESHPRYYLHTVAQYRARHAKAILVYGSATPTIESRYRCQVGETTYIRLKNRVNQKPLPEVEIIDMTDPQNRAEDGVLSVPLRQAISNMLDQQTKGVILLNRRGYAPAVVCSACHRFLVCPSCNLSYTYHRDRVFRCHRCVTTHTMTHRCPSCKKNRLQFSGSGVQRIETVLKRDFPTSTVVRLDRDAIQTQKDLESALDRFKQEGDILLGTQLVAKGHHFEDVTLVGVLGADTMLNIPDFRSSERVFQLITQVAGRAGRGEKTGKVWVQTAQPHHYAIDFAKTHDYDGFYEQETAFREALFYPPYSTIMSVIFSSTSPQKVKQTAENWASQAKQALDGLTGLSLIGPKPAPIEMIRAHYRWNLVIKMPPALASEVKTRLTGLETGASQAVRVFVDYEPRNLL